LNTRWDMAAASDFGSDVDVLNYALTLEYLEATFYEQGNAANLVSGQDASYLADIQKDEEAHVAAITSTIKKLGGTPVAKPMVDFGDAFSSKKKFLTTSHTFENVGVGAYLGAAGFIKNKNVLQAAASIFGVEARHAAIVGNLLGLAPEGGVYMGAFESPLTKSKVLGDVAPFLASQMGTMPSGSVNTGGGSTAGLQDEGLLAGGAAALIGAGVGAVCIARRRGGTEGDSAGDA
ncbi:MAG: ferritin-like domain-containing protein, partial [Sciscionella sp.]